MGSVDTNNKSRLSKRAKMIQLGVFFLLTFVSLLYNIVYVLDLANVVSTLEENTKKAESVEFVSEVTGYTVNMTGTVDVSLVDGTQKSLTLNNLVLVRNLPSGIEGGLVIDKNSTPSELVLCKPNKNFTINYLIGSKLIFITIGVFIILAMAMLRSSDKRLIFQYRAVTVTLYALCFINAMLGVITLTVLR